VNLEPIVIQHWRDHEFVGPRKKNARCQQCKRGQHTVPHLGHPRSMNVRSNSSWFDFDNQNKDWKAVFNFLFEEAGLPRGMERCLVEGMLVFPTRGRRDQGNFRTGLEKYLGDALKDGGWLKDDDWSRYEFGGLTAAHEPRVSGMVLMLMPDMTPPENWPPPFDSSALAPWVTLPSQQRIAVL
jgi:hypothetical protein